MWNYLGALKKLPGALSVPWGLKHSIMRKKIGQNLFSTGKIAFFFKFLGFQQPLRCIEMKWSCNLHSLCQNTCGPTKTVPWGLSHSIRRERRSKSFLYWEDCHFFKYFCFQQPLRCYRIDLVTSTVIVRLPCWPLWSEEEVKIWRFYTGKIAIFSNIFVFNNLLGATELIL